MKIIHYHDNLFVVQHESFKSVNQLRADNPNVRYIINVPDPKVIVTVSLMNALRLIQSRFVVYATIDVFEGQKSFIKVHTIDTDNGLYYHHRFTYDIGENEGIEESKIEELGKLLFGTNECWKCKYVGKEQILNCAVNPSLILNTQGRCGDYELASHRKFGL
jgi:hypothetical protein